MKSRLKKERMRNIIAQNKLIEKNPMWWGDKEDEFYAPFVNKFSKAGLYLDFWSYKKTSPNEFRALSCSFVYTYLTNNGSIKNNIARLYFSEDIADNEGTRCDELVYSEDKELEMKVYFNKNFHCGEYELAFFIHAKTCSFKVVEKALLAINEKMSTFYKAKLFLLGSKTIHRKNAMEEFNILSLILRSYWDYAKNNCTHVYTMKKGASSESIDVENMFNKVELQEAELTRYKDEYNKLYYIMLYLCGNKTTDKIIESYKKDSLKKD